MQPSKVSTTDAAVPPPQSSEPAPERIASGRTARPGEPLTPDSPRNESAVASSSPQANRPDYSFVSPIRVGRTDEYDELEQLSAQLALSAHSAASALVEEASGLLSDGRIDATTADAIQLIHIATPASLLIECTSVRLQAAASQLDALADLVGATDNPLELRATAQAISTLQIEDLLGGNMPNEDTIACEVRKISQRIENLLLSEESVTFAPWLEGQWEKLAKSICTPIDINGLLGVQLVVHQSASDVPTERARAFAEIAALSQLVQARIRCAAEAQRFLFEHAAWQNMRAYQESFTGLIDAPMAVWEMMQDGIQSAAEVRFAEHVAANHDIQTLKIAVARPYELYPPELARRITAESPEPVHAWNPDSVDFEASFAMPAPEVANEDMTQMILDSIDAAGTFVDVSMLTIVAMAALSGAAFTVPSGGASLVITIVGIAVMTSQMTFASLDKNEKRIRGVAMMCTLHSAIAQGVLGTSNAPYEIAGFKSNGNLTRGVSMAESAEHKLEPVRRAIVKSVEVERD